MPSAKTKTSVTLHFWYYRFCQVILGGVVFLGLVFGEETFQYDSKGKRDPFVPLISSLGAYSMEGAGIDTVKDVRLEGIVWDEGKGSVAIINGQILREGQKIGDLEILKIEKKSVIFDVDGEEVKIELRED